MTLGEPGKRRAMYSTVVLVWLATPGCGPSGFAREPFPLPLATSNFLPSGGTRTEVGYHPTGIKPRDRLFRDLLTSKTATKLLSALAMKSVFSFGERARLLGVEPEGPDG